MPVGTRKTAQAATSVQRRSSTSLSTPTEIPNKTMENNNYLLEEMRRLQAETHKEIWSSRDELKSEIVELKARLDKIDLDIVTIKDKVNNLEKRTENLEKQREDVIKESKEEQEQVLRIQLKQRENCLKLRGLPEKGNENLYVELSPILANFIEESEDHFPWELDRVYRLNSKIAKMKNQPRDVVVYFVRKQTRDIVLQHSYKKKLVINGKEILILKDIPGKILKKRRDYYLVSDKLKNLGLPFKWDEIEGLHVFWEEKRIRVNSSVKAAKLLEDLQRAHEKKKSVDDTKGGGGPHVTFFFKLYKLFICSVHAIY
ncbi:uncharacterized protein LOC121924788 [Sceloporus undulatus]|uniref:uncharacterized protein LOC121924788 n=1 Tax=Sceloporus undulatus TaxID=8520 RepID=UPI001C4B72EB|nr:uncharacterized protein LOC121924788 [Sceloporus undulatus]